LDTVRQKHCHFNHENRPAQGLLVLVPHRDTRLPLRAWSKSLFATGLPGAWSFPWVTPLALLGRPLSTAELKPLAGSMREHINSCGGKIICGLPATAEIPFESGAVSVFGPALNTELPGGFFDAAAEAVLTPVSPLVLGSAVVGEWGVGSGEWGIGNREDLPNLPLEVSFRAGALANMSFRPLTAGGYSFEWDIGALCWLPKH